jgi:hypothetical protein
MSHCVALDQRIDSAVVFTLEEDARAVRISDIGPGGQVYRGL